MVFARGTRILSAAFAISGTVHLVRPRTFEPLMPSWVPAHREVILASGVAELVCAAGLNTRRTRRVAGLVSALLLVAVFPGNLKMAADAARTDNTPLKAAALGRLPLQLPLIRAALGAARG
ncbi:hypothetical protein [Nocardioides sp. CER19]|uniref:DoxX family protein n=1 Tax=Nocardioides sp. CER19 TaxID=3038538 RepID=UPI0024474D8E|nr:hypothetical protein [Nocardioides sp. CER19]MDH2416841.1 hypothetical protein [Nocardioides sp. CER19]